MYMAQAKKEAEKAEKKRQKEREREERRKAYARKKEQKLEAKAAKKSSSTSKAAPSSSTSKSVRTTSGANEAAHALAAQQQRVADEKRRAEERKKEEARQKKIRETRAALSSESEYTDRIVEQVSAPKRERVFSQVDNPNNNSEWSDQSVDCSYVGTFEVGTAQQVDKTEVKRGINAMQDHLRGERKATLIICLEGIKVIDASSNKVAMAHALNRVSMAAADTEFPLFGFVAKNPGVNAKYCHVFHMRSRRHAESVQGVVNKAFRLAYAKKRMTDKKPAHPTSAGPDPAPKAPHLKATNGSKPRSASQRPPAAAAAAPAPHQEPRVANRHWAKHNPLPAPARESNGGRSSSGSSNHVAPVGKKLSSRHSSRPPAHAPPPAMAPVQPAQPAHLAPAPVAAPAATAPPARSGPPTPEGHLHDDLENCAWFQAGIPREIAMELLDKEDEGSFVVRESSSQPGCYALTMKGGGLMHHFLIRMHDEGFVLGTEDQCQMPYPSLTALITAYTKSKGCLPCCLNLDSFNTAFEDGDHDNGEGHTSFIDPEYQDMVSLMKAM
eukprot:m.164658 g.164658  ORF g.164658 m.164658 type:complete len:554 (-) comp12453_c0_seq1:126-1787(-)